MPTGSAAFDFYGADRHGDNLFANTIICLDAKQASASGTSKRSSMMCGTSTFLVLPCWLRFDKRANWWTPLRKPAKTASYTF